MTRAARTFLCALLVPLAACRTTGTSWTSDETYVLHSSEALEIKASTSDVEPDGEHAFLHWAGARSKPGEALIEEFLVVVFDDRNGNGVPDAGEVLESKSSREATSQVMVAGVRVPVPARREALMGWARVRTAARTEAGQWRLLVR